ncbi:MAG: sigma-70 family RNA polymerase sigma factor, partial [Victivallales bacterium]|nr:sigma-70 family RNA polymerase sigma factor [Victivallales bacterium]
MAYTTNHTLLQQMRAGDGNSWEIFREFYRPLIARRGMDYRLTPEEIDTLIQDVLVVCFRERVLENYDRTKGRFRDYLRTIVSRNAHRILEARPTNVDLGRYGDIPAEPPADTEAQAWQEFLRDRALLELRESMDSLKFMAFEMYELQGQPAAEVAKCLGMTSNQVWLIASRTKK